MRFFKQTALFLTLLALFQMTPSYGAGKGGISRAKALKVAVAKYPGKVVKISDGKKHYQIRIVQKDGRVVLVEVDKNTGVVRKSRNRGR